MLSDFINILNILVVIAMLVAFSIFLWAFFSKGKTKKSGGGVSY